MAKQVLGFEIVIDGLGNTVETATELKRAIEAINKQLKLASDVNDIKRLEAQLVDLKAAQMEVNKITREQIKARNEEITATDKANGAYRKLSKELNDQRNRYKDLAAAEQETSQEAKDLMVSITALDKRLKGIDASVGQFQRNVGGYTEALSQFFPRLGGTIGSVTGLVGDLSSGFANLSKVGGGIPKGIGMIGIALTAFQGISNIFTELSRSALELKSVSNSISNFVQVTDTDLTKLAVKSTVIAETYKRDVNEITRAANTASKELGISFDEALNNIEIGFRKGADANGEFLDNLREYPAQFAAAGLGIKEYLAVAVAAANQGIYSDKGLDVVKEFGLRIREQTKATKDAITDAFGEEFSNRIFGLLNKGSITTAEALIAVTEKMGEVGIEGNKLQTIIADVFGAPGEDAGLKFILTLKDIIKNSNEVDKSLTKQQKATKDTYDVTLELAESQAKASLAIANTTQSLSLATKEFRVYINRVITGIFDANDKIEKAAPKFGSALSMGFGSQTLAGIERNIRQVERMGKESIERTKKANEDAKKEEEDKNKLKKKQEEDLQKIQEQKIALLNTEKGIEDEISRLKAKKSKLQIDSKQFAQTTKEIADLEAKLEKLEPKESGRKAGETFVKSFVEGSLKKLQEEQSNLQTEFSEAVVGSATQKELAVKLNAINNQIKDAIEQQNQILEDASRGNLLKNLQQAQQLATLPLTIQPLKSIKQSDLDKKEAEEIKKVQNEIIKSSNEANKKRIDNEEKFQEELYKNRQKNIELAGEGALLLTNLFSTIQSARFKKDQEALDQQILNTENNIATLEAKADKASGIRKKKIEKDIANEKLLLEEKNKQQQELQLKAAKQEKKIAIIQSIIQGALAVQRALNSFPFPPLSTGQAIAAGIFAGIQTATIIAQPLAEGGVVTGQRVNQKQNIPTRSNGDNVLAYVKRGEVVLNQRQQQLLGGYPTFKKIGIKGFADGGIVPPINAPVGISDMNQNMSNIISVIDAKTDAINSRIDRLQAYVVSDDIARDLAEGNKLKINATL